MVVGVVIIMVSYFGLRSGGTQILYLLAGAVCVAAGFLLATRYR
jgi:drug/metabolite transporter (DMT)-like permease